MYFYKLFVAINIATNMCIYVMYREHNHQLLQSVSTLYNGAEQHGMKTI